ncbi:MAG: DUF4625 domain-containing protein [Bacteroidetes bacterium]|nr:DUF4625 domain-containing protein [Bacteroidota bacterium]
MKSLNIILLLVITIFATSCNSDKEDPVIEISSPANHSEHHWGDEIEVKAKFTDDQELMSFSAMIGDIDGNHTHEFHFMDSGNISGTEYEYSGTITVPTGIEEVYYLHITVTDAEEKSTTEKVMLHFHED